MQALYLRVIFLVFEAVSGLKVNLSKSIVFSVNAEDSIAEFAEILRCKIEAFPTTHLGLPLELKRVMWVVGSIVLVIRSKKGEDFGVRNLNYITDVFYVKWLWRLNDGKDALWNHS